jgi:hemerythrin-like domain-containing protein
MSQPNSWGILMFHRAMRQDLEFLSKVFARIDPASPVAQVARKRIDMFGVLVAQHHQTEDDFLFPLLKKVDSAFELGGLDTEHTALHTGVEKLRAAADAFLASTGANQASAREAVLRELAQLRDIVGNHLDHEEAECCKRVDTLLDASMMKKFEQDSAKGMSLSLATQMIPWLLSHSSPEDRKIMEPLMPWPIRTLNRLFWQRSFDRNAAMLG